MSEPTESQTAPVIVVDELNIDPALLAPTPVELHHQVHVPKGVLQLLLEEGTEPISVEQLVSLLRWTADSLAGECVPMEYQLGQEWNEAKRLEFDVKQCVEWGRIAVEQHLVKPHRAK